MVYIAFSPNLLRVPENMLWKVRQAAWTDEVGLTMLLGFVILLLALSEAFLVAFLVAINRDKRVARAGLEFQQVEIRGRQELSSCAEPGSGKVNDGFASESTRINWRKRDLAPGGIVLWTGQRMRSERQRGRDDC